jgi:poly-gamma-glutamate capsule biosynthesis protein CapA/YwtB (metallophosphatase superfamily)
VLRSVLFLLLLIPLLGYAEEGVVRLAAVGDVMLGRTVEARLAAHGGSWAWEALQPELRQAELRFCNLECAITQTGTPIPKRYSFRASPTIATDVLQSGGFNLVALANNHTYDYGRLGLTNTIAALDAMHVAYAGVGKGRAGAIAPRVITCNGLKIAMVAYTWWPPEGYVPSENGAAVAMLDEATFATELKTAQQGADLLIVSLHWGKEYSAGYASTQQRTAHLAIDAGADLILGHHPHIVQPVEVYKERPILYSLGNCLFDRTNTRYSNGALALIRLTRTQVTVEQFVRFELEDARPVRLREGAN